MCFAFMEWVFKMAKLRVGIVFGGKSAEHEVSLQSAKNIVDAIDKTRFDVVLLGIDNKGNGTSAMPVTICLIQTIRRI